MNEKPLREALEACRPGSDDLSLPELADLARAAGESSVWRDALASVRQSDEAISRALQDVDIPAGLEHRLLAAVEAQADADASQTALTGTVSPAQPRRVSRRTWLTLASALAAGVILAAWGVQQWRRAPVLAPENLGFEALAWSQNLTDEWRETSEARGLNRPLDRQVRYAPRGWQSLDTNHDATAVAYDLTRPRGTAILFVLAPAAIPDDLNTSATRIPSTGGWGAAAWKSGAFVYVLLVEERRQKLDDFLASPAAEIVLSLATGAPRRAS